ncbi:MAG TPA: hypothetical protein VFN57_14725 [Thermomicrobiaceae bacterium]|nr:hypothetical protein [Thermomicrobiaceae bacterium]
MRSPLSRSDVPAHIRPASRQYCRWRWPVNGDDSGSSGSRARRNAVGWYPSTPVARQRESSESEDVPVRQWINLAVQVGGTLAVLAFAYLVISFPDGYQLSRFSLDIDLFVLAALAALIVRSWWSLALFPTMIIIGILAAGIHVGLIQDLQQLIAESFNVEFFTLPPTVLGAFVATLAPRLIARGIRSLRRSLGPAAAPEPPAPEQSPFTPS